MVSDLVRDKDGISAALVFAELCLGCRTAGESVLGRLERLYRQFGLYVSAQRTVALAPDGGAERARALMDSLRKTPPHRVTDRAVLAVRDFGSVLSYDLEGDTRVVVRPSGTEPKLKLYFDHREPLDPAEPLANAETRAAQELHCLGEAWLTLLND
jgi:phosphomannomutase